MVNVGILMYLFYDRNKFRARNRYIFVTIAGESKVVEKLLRKPFYKGTMLSATVFCRHSLTTCKPMSDRAH